MNFNKNPIILFLFPIILFGQGGWEYQNFSPGNLTSVCFVDSLTGWAVGDEELIHTTDGGKSWKYQDASRLRGEYMNSVFFKNKNLGWIVGSIILHTTDGGQNWTGQERGANQNKNYELRSVFFYDEKIGWASGDSSLILRTTDGGLNWQSQSVGNNIQTVYSIYFIDSLKGWAVKQNEVLQSTNSGVSWNKIYTVNVNYLSSIFFLDSLYGWTVGGSGVIFNTIDGGKNWNRSTIVDSPYFDINLSSVYFSDLNNGFVIGEDWDAIFEAHAMIFKTTDGGKNWTSPNYDQSLSELNSLSFVNGKFGWIVGGNSILYTNNGGNDWINQESKIPPYSLGRLLSLDIVNEKIVWVVGFGGNTLITTDGGENWNQKFMDRNMEDVCFIDEYHGWIVGNGTILNTLDGGNNWNEQTAPWNLGQLTSVSFLDENTGWCVGWYEPILKTTDGGQNWKANTPEYYYLRDSYFLNKDYGWVAGTIWMDDSLQHSHMYGHILRTTNGGESWEDYRTEEGHYLFSIYFINAKIGWAVGTSYNNGSGVVLKTTDGGISWATKSFLQSSAHSVFFINKDIGWITEDIGKILISVDGGESWSEQFSTYRAGGLYAIQFVDEKTGWAVGDYNTILKTSNGGVIFVEVDNNSLTPSEFLLYQNYPNPFNPSTKISWQSPLGSWQTLRVYDVLGNEIATLVDEYMPAGKYEVEFQSSIGNRQLASGVYFYQLQVYPTSSGAFVETKKMILLR